MPSWTMYTSSGLVHSLAWSFPSVVDTMLTVCHNSYAAAILVDSLSHLTTLPFVFLGEKLYSVVPYSAIFSRRIIFADFAN